MKKVIPTEDLGVFDKLLLSIDTAPWDAVYRTAIGFATLAALPKLQGEARSGWTVVPFLLVVLVLMRLVPAVIRKLLRFSPAVQAVWTERRQLAKRFDSYQWRKLFWIGVGLAAYTVYAGQFLSSQVTVASFCLLTGSLGLARWRAIAPRPHATSVPVKPARDLA